MKRQKKGKLKEMNNNTIIPNLDEIVLKSLDFFKDNPPNQFDAKQFEFPFVVGSGNAYNTGLILFSQIAAIYADESNFKALLPSFKKAIDQGLIKDAVVISASGGKDSVWEIEFAKKYNLSTTLLTTKENSDAAQIADRVYASKSIPEPYTYNTSTYMGMMLAATGENTEEIKKHIENLKFPDNFSDYNSYSFVLPDKYSAICPMLDIKKDELFGPMVSLRAFPQGHARHAKFVNRVKEEMVISINLENKYYGDPQSRWDINLSDSIDFAGLMAVTYFVVGKIQKFKPQYFKENIGNYVSDYGPKAYGENTKQFDLIVPGSQ